jgi:myo-inositol 2-dehydrogenase/D-chiro-inositol 1-dehydrogenase
MTTSRGKPAIGIIGAGYIGRVHAGLLAQDDRVGITRVFDVARDRAESLAKACGAEVSGSSESLIEDVDAVYITTPNTRHTHLALDALTKSRHVFCEKPMATTVEDARQVLEAASKSSTVFQVGHNRRFAPVYVLLKQLTAERGPVHSAHVKMNRGELTNPAWVGDPTVTGGFLYETTIHMFDMLRFQFGEVVEIHAFGSKHEYSEVDDFSVVLKFAGGMHASLSSSADASWLFPFERIEAFCHHSTIVTREMESLTLSEGLKGEHVTHSMHQLSREQKWGYEQEDRAFVTSVLEGSPAAVTALDGYKSVGLVDACYRAVQLGETLRFDRSELKF